jgi:hypothetical protein
MAMFTRWSYDISANGGDELHDVIHDSPDDVVGCLEVLNALSVCCGAVLDALEVEENDDITSLMHDIEGLANACNGNVPSLTDEIIVNYTNELLDVFYDFCDRERIWTGIGCN